MACRNFDIHLGLQCFLYLAMSLLGLAVALPLLITYVNFDTMCMLYAEFDKDGHKYQSSYRSRCNYPVGVSVICGVVYGIAMTILYVREIFKGDETTGSRMYVWLPLFINSGICLAVFVSSCMISVGFKMMCDSFEAAHGFSCELGQQLIKWDVDSHVNGDSYYTCFKIAEISSWTFFLAVAAQVVLGISRVYRNHRQSGGTTGASRHPADMDNFAAVEPTA